MPFRPADVLERPNNSLATPFRIPPIFSDGPELGTVPSRAWFHCERRGGSDATSRPRRITRLARDPPE